MPIGKNSIRRVVNSGYSNLKTEAPDMENSHIDTPTPEVAPTPVKKATKKGGAKKNAPETKKTKPAAEAKPRANSKKTAATPAAAEVKAPEVKAEAPAEKAEKPENASEKPLPYELRLALKRGVAIVDSNYAINYYDDCKKIEHLLIPRFCLNEMKRVAQFAPTAKERQAIERKVRYFEKKAEILYVDNLPEISICETNREFKPRSFNFARYVQYVWQIHGFKVPYLTRAYEANTLIKECVKLEVTQG